MPSFTLHHCLHNDLLGSRLGRRIKWSLLAAGLTISMSQAKAEYIASVGDVLEVSVAGVPELKQRAAVQIDGNISLPLVGILQVAGLSLPQIQSKVGGALASKVFRQRTSDGRETTIVIDADEVTATVAEYRPIYVNGDVSKPGEYPYRPSTTARQLIAVAGGFEKMHMRRNNPYL
jgi:polysaccharide export outer membrane protein